METYATENGFALHTTQQSLIQDVDIKSVNLITEVKGETFLMI